MPACGTYSWRLPGFLSHSPYTHVHLPLRLVARLQSPCLRRLHGAQAEFTTWPLNSEDPIAGTRRLRPSRLSPKKIKKLRISPNELLHDAISNIPGQEYMFFNPIAPKPNLSYENIRLRTDPSRNLHTRKRPSSEAIALARETPQGVVAGIIRRAVSANNTCEDFSHVSVPDSDIAILNQHGHDVDDARFWARILTAPDANDAAKWILQSEVLEPDAKLQARPVPTFVALMTLKRHRLTVEALRDMFLYAMQQLYARQSHNSRLHGEKAALENNIEAEDTGLTGTDTETVETETYAYNTNNNTIMARDDASLFLLVVRLLRHARSVWPDSIVSIAKLFVHLMDCYVAQPGGEDRAKSRKRRGRVEFLYNTMLRLLATPASINPVEHAGVYQDAQFELLGRMAMSQPAPIVLYRKSYRAIISVQLAMRKSQSEKDWARLKAKSWPPVMEPKMGADELKGPEDGQSRAMQAIYMMKEAGYGSREWENAAQILAGWDLDHSPTIQRRTLNLRADLGTFLNRYKSDPQVSVWAARVRATRTVDEAWACFLEWKDFVRQPNVAVYLQMLEKLHYENLRLLGKQSVPSEGSDELYPGDYKEIMEPPQDPRDATYVRIRPPTFHSLAMEMLEDTRMRTGNADIKQLLEHAPSFAAGLKYCILGTRSSQTLAQCLQGTIDITSLLRMQIPYNILSPFLNLLSRYPFETSTPMSAFTHGDVPPETPENVEHRPPIEVAIKLLQHLKPIVRPPWHIAMGMIARTTVKRTADGVVLNYRAVKTWAQSMDSMGLGTDFDTFRLVCSVLAHAARTPQQGEDPGTSAQSTQKTTAKRTQKSSSFNSIEESEFVKGWFHLLISGRVPRRRSKRPVTRRKSVQDVQDSLPSLLHTPPASALHQYVRALGYLQDWSGLLNLIHWMFGSRNELMSYNSRRNNGLKLLRRSIVALRACVEGHLQGETGRNQCPPEILSAMQSLLSQASVQKSESGSDFTHTTDTEPEIFSWPSDEELDEYLEYHRGTLVHS